MRYMTIRRAGMSLALAALATIGSSARADEPGLIGRIFRTKNDASAAPASADPTASVSARSPTAGMPPMPSPTMPGMSSTPGYLGGSGGGYSMTPSAYSTPGGMLGPMTMPSTTPQPSSGPVSRITPQPRTTKAATESDPLVTRISLGRADGGSQFAMMLQVYADGTVIDSEGVHHVSREALKPIVDAIQAGEITKQRGHCGGPPTDFIEQVHLVVYERSLGRLKATAFSYSGNTQGCDHSVRHMQTSLDALQAKVSGNPMPTTGSAPTVTNAAPTPMSPEPTTSHVASPTFPRGGSRIGLTPIR